MWEQENSFTFTLVPRATELPVVESTSFYVHHISQIGGEMLLVDAVW